MHGLKRIYSALLLSALLAMLAPARARAGDPAPKVYTLDLTGKGTLGDVYAAGLRPKRWESSAIEECFVENKRIAFKIDANRTVTLFASHCEFKVLRDGALISVDARSPNVSTETAREWMLPIVKTLNGSIDELDSYLQLVRTGDRQTEQRLRIEEDSSGFAVKTAWPGPQTDLPALSVSMRWRWDKEFPIAIAVMITWARPYSSMRVPSKPLVPPPGFEQFPIVTEPYVPGALRAQEAVSPGLTNEQNPGSQSAKNQIATSGGATNQETAAQETGPDLIGSAGNGRLKLWILALMGGLCCAVLWIIARRHSRGK